MGSDGFLYNGLLGLYLLAYAHTFFHIHSHSYAHIYFIPLRIAPSYGLIQPTFIHPYTNLLHTLRYLYFHLNPSYSYPVIPFCTHTLILPHTRTRTLTLTPPHTPSHPSHSHAHAHAHLLVDIPATNYTRHTLLASTGIINSLPFLNSPSFPQ